MQRAAQEKFDQMERKLTDQISLLETEAEHMRVSFADEMKRKDTDYARATQLAQEHFTEEMEELRQKDAQMLERSTEQFQAKIQHIHEEDDAHIDQFRRRCGETSSWHVLHTENASNAIELFFKVLVKGAMHMHCAFSQFFQWIEKH